jgi:hypothetical protein
MDAKNLRQLALDLLDRLTHLEAERNAMAGILIHVKARSGEPLDWRRDVKNDCGPMTGKALDDALQTFAILRQQIESSEPNSTDGLTTLASVPLVPIWEYPKPTVVEGTTK